MNAVLGSKAQHQVLVTPGSSISTVSGDGGRQDSPGSLSEISRELFRLAFMCFRQNPQVCAHMHAHTHTQPSPTHYPDPSTYQTHLAKF